MTDPTQPQPRPSWGPPPAPPGPDPSPSAPKPPFHRRGWFLILAGAIVGLLVGVAISGEPSSDPGRGPAATTGRPAATARATTAEVTSPPATEEPAVVPKAKDFKLSVKVLSKQCFGSAGCNLTYRVDAGWPDGLDPDVEYEVVYEVRGGEDGPQVNTMTVQGDSYERPQEESISTSSAGRRLTAVVTSVEEA